MIVTQAFAGEQTRSSAPGTAPGVAQARDGDVVREFLATGRHVLDPRLLDEQRIEHDGKTRYYLVYRPTGMRDGAPAVFLLHGGMQDMWGNFAGNPLWSSPRWLELANEHGFLIVAPNGTHQGSAAGAGDEQIWNGLPNRTYPSGESVDDVGFITAVAVRVTEEHALDPRLIYVSGIANGGQMVFRMLTEQPGLFAAAVVNLASLPATPLAPVARATPVMVLAGTTDPLTLWDGGPVDLTRAPSRSVAQTVAFWAAANGVAQGDAETDAFADRNPDDGCRLTRTTYRRQPGGLPLVVLYAVEGGGHTMPTLDGPPVPDVVRQVAGDRCRSADGVALAWEFLRQHGLANSPR